MAKTLEQQLTCAQERARTAKAFLSMIGFTSRGFIATVLSERDAIIEYRITRYQATGNLVCTCPATVVCKHIGACLNEGTSYHSNSIPADQYPVTPNPNRPTADSPEAALVAEVEEIATFPLLMNIAAEVAIAEEVMEAAGFFWSAAEVTWLPNPTIAQRAAAAMPLDRTPETWSIFVEATR